MESSIFSAYRAFGARRGWVAPVLVVLAVLLILAAGLGLRALLRDAAEADAARRPASKPDTFHWPVTQAAAPGAGIVATLHPEEGYASVGDIRPEEWKRNDEVRFVDGDGSILAHGAVRAIVNGKLRVQYEPAPAAARGLQPGDRAIRTGKTLAETRPAPAE